MSRLAVWVISGGPTHRGLDEAAVVAELLAKPNLDLRLLSGYPWYGTSKLTDAATAESMTIQSRVVDSSVVPIAVIAWQPHQRTESTLVELGLPGRRTRHADDDGGANDATHAIEHGGPPWWLFDATTIASIDGLLTSIETLAERAADATSSPPAIHQLGGKLGGLPVIAMPPMVADHDGTDAAPGNTPRSSETTGSITDPTSQTASRSPAQPEPTASTIDDAALDRLVDELDASD